MPEDALFQIFIGGGILALILSILFQFWIKKRGKVIETRILQTELINPEISNLVPVFTKVGRSNLALTSAYKHTIFIKNVGLDEIEEPEIDISFDAKARIYDVQINSRFLTDDKIKIPTSSRRINYCRVIPEYINSGHDLIIVITTLNNEIRNCNVDVRGAGVFHRRKIVDINWYLVATVILLLIVAISYLSNFVATFLNKGAR